MLQPIWYMVLLILWLKRPAKIRLNYLSRPYKMPHPRMEVRPRRIGGATYQIPMEVPTHRQFTLATRWLLEAARSRKGQPFDQCLADELLSAVNNEGLAIRKREEAHRMAKANRAFSHFRVNRIF